MFAPKSSEAKFPTPKMRSPAHMIMQKQTDFDPAVSGDLNIRVHGPG